MSVEMEGNEQRGKMIGGERCGCGLVALVERLHNCVGPWIMTADFVRARIGWKPFVFVIDWIHWPPPLFLGNL